MNNHRKLKYYRSLKQRITKKSKRQIDIKFRKINVQKMDQQNSILLFQTLAKGQPLKLTNCQLPTYKMPQSVKVIIQTDKHNTMIPYQDEQEVILSEIPSSQFLQYNGDFNLSIAQMKLHPQQTDIPQFVKDYFTIKKGGIERNQVEAINLWYYKGKRVSTWHYDGYDNFLFLLKGKKVVFLHPPNITKKPSSPFVTKGIFNLNNNHLKQGYSKRQSFKDAYRCEINEGECLFIPRAWWHYVQSQGSPNIAINIWGNSFKKTIDKNQCQPMLKFLIFQLSQRYEQARSSRESLLSESDKERERRYNFLRYLNKNI